jgi:ATP/maltotriose-dependent transcriptional regulator MalT
MRLGYDQPGHLPQKRSTGSTGVADRIAELDRAREALRRESWAEAYEDLRNLDASLLAPQDLEGLADAAWWLARSDESIAARRHAYERYSAEGRYRRAAYTAFRFFLEYFFQANVAEAAGWLMRAQRHLSEEPECVEGGYVALGWAYAALVRGEPSEAEDLAQQAASAARRFRDADLTALAIDVHGRALIAQGMVAKGMSLLDEAMTSVVAGELSSLVTGAIYCNVLAVCLELADLGRAGRWTESAAAWCRSLPPEAPFLGLCRLNRALVSTFQGAWAEAEAEALRASREVAFNPFAVGQTFYSIGEIRRRLGDLTGAEEAFMQANEIGVEPQPGLALLRLAQGKVEPALAALRVAIAAEPAGTLRRSRLLGALVEVALRAGHLDEATSATDELESIAERFGTSALGATAAAARGAVRLAEGDLPGALERLRRALDLCQELRLPYEGAQARMLYGIAVRRAGAEEEARLELDAARTAFERLGAAADARGAAELLARRGDLPRGLSEREVEVLRLIAAGKTNRQIAEELVISDHTVARHVQNIFAKLDVSSRAAATAFAFEHGLV